MQDASEPLRVCVTGAGGYLGRGVTRALLDMGNEVLACDLSLNDVDRRAERAKVDVLSDDDFISRFGEIDILCHLAWKDGFDHQSPAHLNNLASHCAFLEQVASFGNCKLCVMGSMHEVGYYEGVVTAETPCKPLSRYGIAKNALREYVELISKESGSTYQWLRGFYIVDGDVRGSSIFSKIAQASRRGESTFPFTSGKNKYDFLNYDDFCIRVASAIVQNDFNGVINICSGRPESLSSRVSRFIEDEGYEISLEYGAFPDRSYDSPAIWGDAFIIDSIMNRQSHVISTNGE